MSTIKLSQLNQGSPSQLGSDYAVTVRGGSDVLVSTGSLVSHVAPTVWSSGVTYYPGQLVAINDNVYSCILENTNEPPPNATYWTLIGPATLDALSDGSSYARTLAISLEAGVPYTFLGAWSSATSYVVGQEVTYLGSYWICVANNSNSAPSQSNTNWGLEGTAALLMGAWSNSTAYVEGNQVSYAGNIYSCIKANTDEGVSNSTYWTLLGPANLDAVTDGSTYARTLALGLELGVPFTFLGAWSSATSYLVGQEVTYLGAYWIAVVANSNSAPSQSNTNWGLEGTAALLLGAWSSSTAYVEGNQVSLAGNLYSCILANTNHTPPNGTYWLLVGPQNLDALGNGSTYAKVLASALTNGIPTPFTGVWSSSTTYLPGQECTYTGSYWVCLVQCLNSAPSTGNTNWQQVGTVANQFQGAYNSGAAYLVGNEVTYGSPAGLYICIVNSTGNDPTNGSYWQEIATPSTANYLGAYDNGTAYVTGNQVSYQGCFWVCVSNSTGNAPSTTSGYWTLLGTSTIMLGAWSSGTAYVQGNQCTLVGNVYQCVAANTNQEPPNAVYWQLIGPANLDAIIDGDTYARTLALSLENGVPFTYLGDWSSATSYLVGQEVTYLGAYWICVINNSNSAPSQANANWGIEGSAALLMGAWSSSTAYVVSNQVTLAGNVYSCIEANTNETPPNSTYWQLLGPATLDDIQDGSSYARTKALALNNGVPYTYLGDWSSATSYVVGQEVTYLGAYWICIVNNSNSAPTQANTNWGLEGTAALLMGAWSSSTAYVVGNQVSLAGNIYSCVEANTNHTPPNATYWTLMGPATLDAVTDGSTYARTKSVALTAGIPYTYLGAWSSATSYLVGQEVTYLGNYWIAVVANSNSAPTTTNTNWGLEGTSALLLGAWSSSTAYVVGNQVSLSGNIYSCVLANTNETPPNGTYWTLMGPATLDAVTDGSTYARTLAVSLSSGVPYTFLGAWSSATSYLIGQEVTYLGNYWICVANNSNSAPTPTNTNWGLEGTSAMLLGAWSSSTAYVAGNQVTLSGNIYSCILANTNNTPPNATYWTLMGPANLDYLGDGSSYGKVLLTATTDGSVDPSKSGVLVKGSLFPAMSTVIKATATPTTVTLTTSPSAFIARADGTITLIGSTSQEVTGLVTGNTYGFYPYWDESTSELKWVAASDAPIPNMAGVEFTAASSQYVEMGATMSSPTSAGFSIECWFSGTGGYRQSILGMTTTQNYTGTPTTCYMWLEVSSTGQVIFGCKSTTGYESLVTTLAGSGVLDGSKHHIVVTAVGVQYSIYIDGAYVASDNTGYTIYTTANNYYMHIGYDFITGGSGVFADGTISHVAYYPTPLVQGQVMSHCQAMTNINLTTYAAEVVYDGATHYWKMTETSGTSAADSIGSITGTYVGSPTLNYSLPAIFVAGSPQIAWPFLSSVGGGYGIASILALQAQVDQSHIPLSTGSVMATTPASGTAVTWSGGTGQALMEVQAPNPAPSDVGG